MVLLTNRPIFAILLGTLVLYRIYGDTPFVPTATFFVMVVFGFLILRNSVFSSLFLPSTWAAKSRMEEFRTTVRDLVTSDPDMWLPAAIPVAPLTVLDALEFHVASQKNLAPAQQKWLIWMNANGVCFEEIASEVASNVGQELNFNVLFVNYRGVAGSTGFPYVAQDLVDDGCAALKHLTSRGVLDKNILVHGHSMGGAVAMNVRALHPTGPVCSDRSFSSLANTAQAHVMGPLGMVIGFLVMALFANIVVAMSFVRGLPPPAIPPFLYGFAVISFAVQGYVLHKQFGVRRQVAAAPAVLALLLFFVYPSLTRELPVDLAVNGTLADNTTLPEGGGNLAAEVDSEAGASAHAHREEDDDSEDHDHDHEHGHDDHAHEEIETHKDGEGDGEIKVTLVNLDEEREKEKEKKKKPGITFTIGMLRIMMLLGLAEIAGVILGLTGAVAFLAPTLVKLIGWNLDAYTAYKKIQGSRYVMYHMEDMVIPYERASLHRAIVTGKDVLRDVDRCVMLESTHQPGMAHMLPLHHYSTWSRVVRDDWDRLIKLD